MIRTTVEALGGEQLLDELNTLRRKSSDNA